MTESASSSQALPTASTWIKYRPWLIWSLAAAFYYYEFFLKVSPGVMMPDLMRSFSINATQVGNLAAMYFYIYAFMQIPVGVLLDRYGARILLTLASLTCAFGSYLFANADTFMLAAVGRLLIGFGSSFAIVSAMKLAANWFPLNRFALLVGLIVTVGFTGAISAETPLALLVTNVGWRHSMQYIAMAGFVLSLFIWVVIRNKPTTPMANVQEIDPGQYKSMFSGIGSVLRSKQTWLASLYGGLMFAPTEIMGTWGVSFFEQVYHTERHVAASLIIFFFLGWMVGSPAWGSYSDRIRRRRPSMIIGNIGALCCIVAIIYLPLPMVIMDLVLFSFGFFSSGFLPAFSIVREINLPAYNATALGFINTLNMLVPAMLIPFVGVILDGVWEGQMANGAPLYTAAIFHHALVVIPICMIFSLMILPFIKETNCNVVHE